MASSICYDRRIDFYFQGWTTLQNLYSLPYFVANALCGRCETLFNLELRSAMHQAPKTYIVNGSVCQTQQQLKHFNKANERDAQIQNPWVPPISDAHLRQWILGCFLAQYYLKQFFNHNNVAHCAILFIEFCMSLSFKTAGIIKPGIGKTSHRSSGRQTYCWHINMLWQTGSYCSQPKSYAHIKLACHNMQYPDVKQQSEERRNFDTNRDLAPIMCNTVAAISGSRCRAFVLKTHSNFGKNLSLPCNL